jgi:biopolymer transport protein ExbD
MAMSTGGGTGVRSDINITPLVDVVLVLLIIFMVVTPLLQMGYNAETPPKVDNPNVVMQQSDQIIVRLDDQGRRWINKEMVPEAAFSARLGEALKGRESKLVFFAADGNLPYGDVAAFMDLVRKSGVNNLGIVFDDLEG